MKNPCCEYVVNELKRALNKAQVLEERLATANLRVEELERELKSAQDKP